MQLAILAQAGQKGVAISKLVADLPPRVTASDRLQNFPTELSAARIARLMQGGLPAIAAEFGAVFGTPTAMDTTDGLRIVFQSGEVFHLRPSGNAPELRCYPEADTAERAQQMVEQGLAIMRGWLE